MPLTVLSVALLVGVVALVVDGGGLMEERRHVQATADAAALAAAADLYTNYAINQGTDPSGTASASALAIAAANGFTNDGVQSVVTVSVSPQNYQGGPNAGLALPPGYVEVLIQYNAGRTFSNIFGSGSLPVRARAVARGKWAPISNNVVLLNLNTASALSLSGSASLKVNGGIQINSSSPSGLNLSSLGTVTASSFNLNKAAGSLLGYLLSLLLGPGGTAPTVNYGDPTPDPLRYLSAPNATQLGLTTQGTNLIVSSGTVDLHPGVYNGGITVKGGATVILHANSDGTPGIYSFVGGGLTIKGASTVVKMATGETAGVMLFNNWSSAANAITVSGSASLILTPPTSGPYKGISIFQGRGTPSNAAPPLSITTSGSLNLTGTIYAPYASITMSNASSVNVLGGQIIADTMNLSGSATININLGSNPVANARLLGLME